MYPVPPSCCSPAGRTRTSCAISPSSGYYGPGDPAELGGAAACESLRHPTGRGFEDHAPDGRWYRILRRRVAGGGTVTVMTDITEQKQAEQELAASEAQLHVALDNMPGALVYTDDDLRHRRLQRSLQGDVHRRRRRCCSPASRTPASCATWPRTATTARATSAALVAQRVESLRNPTGRSFEDHAPDGRWYRILRRARRPRRHGDGDDRHHRAEAGRARAARRDAAHRGGEHG